MQKSIATEMAKITMLIINLYFTVVTQDENIDSYSEEVKKRRKAFDDLTTSLIPKTECDCKLL